MKERILRVPVHAAVGVSERGTKPGPRCSKPPGVTWSRGPRPGAAQLDRPCPPARLPAPPLSQLCPTHSPLSPSLWGLAPAASSLRTPPQPWARLVLHVVRVSPPGSQPLGGLPEGGTQGTPGCLASLSAPCVPSTWSIGPLCPPIQVKPQGVKDSGASASRAQQVPDQGRNEHR